MSGKRELLYFALRPPSEQLATVLRLRAAGLSEEMIATTTGLAIDQVRRLLNERVPA